jgi:hypothetical protein
MITSGALHPLLIFDDIVAIVLTQVVVAASESFLHRLWTVLAIYHPDKNMTLSLRAGILPYYYYSGTSNRAIIF